MNYTALSVVGYFFWALMIAAFVVEIWAFIDAVRYPTAAYPAAGSKLSKALWLIILGVALVIGLAGAVNFLTITSFLPIVAFVAAAVYLADMRGKLRQVRGSSSHQGPYGPW